MSVWIPTKHFGEFTAISYDATADGGWSVRCGDDVSSERLTFQELIQHFLKHKQHYTKQFVFCQTFLYAFADCYTTATICNSVIHSEELSTVWIPFYLKCIGNSSTFQYKLQSHNSKKERYCGSLFVEYPSLFYMRQIPTVDHMYTFARAFKELNSEQRSNIINTHDTLKDDCSSQRLSSKLLTAEGGYASIDHFLQENHLYAAILHRYSQQGLNFDHMSDASVSGCFTGQMLNDEIINFYANYLMQQAHFRGRAFIFGSHFWTKLLTSFSKQQFNVLTHLVHNWYSQHRLYAPELKYWFIPMHASNHWSLLVVVNPYNNFIRSENNQAGRLYFLDSFGKPTNSAIIVNPLKYYMKARWKAESDIRNDSSAKENGAKLLQPLSIVFPDVPRQSNRVDCGVFMLEYIECFMIRPLDSEQSLSSCKNWFPENRIREKRVFLYKLIRSLTPRSKNKKRRRMVEL